MLTCSLGALGVQYLALEYFDMQLEGNGTSNLPIAGRPALLLSYNHPRMQLADYFSQHSSPVYYLLVTIFNITICTVETARTSELCSLHAEHGRLPKHTPDR